MAPKGGQEGALFWNKTQPPLLGAKGPRLQKPPRSPPACEDTTEWVPSSSSSPWNSLPKTPNPAEHSNRAISAEVLCWWERNTGPHGNYEVGFDMMTAPKSTFSLQITNNSKHLQPRMNPDHSSQIPAPPGPQKSHGRGSGRSPHLTRIIAAQATMELEAEGGCWSFPQADTGRGLVSLSQSHLGVH